MNKRLHGFTIAEMLISLLIISLVLSAAIPTITKKSASSDSIWQWSASSTSAYFGEAANQTAIIGDMYLTSMTPAILGSYLANIADFNDISDDYRKESRFYHAQYRTHKFAETAGELTQEKPFDKSCDDCKHNPYRNAQYDVYYYLLSIGVRDNAAYFIRNKRLNKSDRKSRTENNADDFYKSQEFYAESFNRTGDKSQKHERKQDYRDIRYRKIGQRTEIDTHYHYFAPSV